MLVQHAGAERGHRIGVGAGQEIEDEDRDEDWQRCFKVEHPNLAALMAEWLGRPTFEEEHRR